MQSRLTSERNNCINKKRLRQDKQVGNVIIHLTGNTQEEKWFDSMVQDMNVSFIYCTSIAQLIAKL